MPDNYGYPYQGNQGRRGGGYGGAYNPVYPQQGQRDPFTGIKNQPYVSFRQETPLDVIGQTANAMQGRYDQNVARMDQIDAMHANLQFLPGDEYIKNNSAQEIRNQIDQVAGMEDFENAMPRLRQITKNFASNELIRQSQANFASHQKYSEKAAELRMQGIDVLDFSKGEQFQTYDQETGQIRAYQNPFEERLEYGDKIEEVLDNNLKEILTTSGIIQDPNNPNYDYYENIKEISPEQVQEKLPGMLAQYIDTNEGNQHLRQYQSGLEVIPQGLSAEQAVMKDLYDAAMGKVGRTSEDGRYISNASRKAAEQKARNASLGVGSYVHGFEVTGTGTAGSYVAGTMFESLDDLSNYYQTEEGKAITSGELPKSLKAFTREQVYNEVHNANPAFLETTNNNISMFKEYITTNFPHLAAQADAIGEVYDVLPETLESSQNKMRVITDQLTAERATSAARMMRLNESDAEEAAREAKREKEWKNWTADTYSHLQGYISPLSVVSNSVNGSLEEADKTVKQKFLQGDLDFGAHWNFFRSSGLSQEQKKDYDFAVDKLNDAFTDRVNMDKAFLTFEEGPEGPGNDERNRETIMEAKGISVAGWTSAESMKGGIQLDLKLRLKDADNNFYVVSFKNKEARDYIIRQIGDPALTESMENIGVTVRPDLDVYSKRIELGGGDFKDEVKEIGHGYTYRLKSEAPDGVPYNHYEKDGKPVTYASWIEESSFSTRKDRENRAITDLFAYNPELEAKFNRLDTKVEQTDYLYRLLENPIMLETKGDFVLYQK